METFECWVHRRRAQIFAIRLDDGWVTGVWGPLDPSQAIDADLSSLPYESHPEAVAGVRLQIEQFVRAEPFLRGHVVPVLAQKERGAALDTQPLDLPDFSVDTF